MTVAVVAGALVMAAWTALRAVLDRPVNDAVLLGLLVVELAVLAQLVLGVVRLAGDWDPDSAVTVVAYLVGALLVLPIGALWSLAERSRPSTLVLTVACLAVPVMTARLWQMWTAS